MIKYKCKNCGYVLAEIKSVFHSMRKQWSAKTVVHGVRGDYEYSGSLSLDEVLRVLGDFCPRCKRPIGSGPTVIIVRCGGREYRREVQ